MVRQCTAQQGGSLGYRVSDTVLALLGEREPARRIPAQHRCRSSIVAEALRRRPMLSDSLRPYFADVQDHCAHVLAELDTHTSLLATALDIYAETVFWRLGTIVKRLTAITVIIMVPNLVASVFGMNFNVLFPPGDWEYGFFVIVGLLAVMVAWGFIHSRILDWL